MNNLEMVSRYEANSCESKWYAAWESAGLFKADPNSSATRFTITIPPPNITGSLHMGHALCYPIQDVVGRFKRLQGYDVLIVPGQDHAGIATQSVVTKQLAAQGVKASEIGREKFLEYAWNWRAESGGTILSQFRSLGCAFDWDHERFTLDEGYVEAVLTVFIDWFRKGLIYRGKRIVNWDPVLKTSVSDIETERKTINGKLYHVRYPFKDGSGHVVVATTRPETILGDVAVAVHPSDSRYTGLHHKTLILPLVNREIPLLPDIYPDPEFGTGAVKVTPAHDPNDFEVGQRHNLEQIVVIDESANICADGPYFGLNRFVARKRIVEDLEEAGLLEKIEDHQIPVIVSDRSKEIIEPLLSEQWFVRQTDLAADAIKVLDQGDLRFVPERYNKVYRDWLENIRDWCISRQLWWGHRIPVYYTESGKAIAALSWEEAQVQAGEEKIVRQDEDVLDTWFSSGLWPFATLGWPEQTELLQERYPTSLLVTDRGIIYLWVARMVMMGMAFMGRCPFSEVYIHATVLNSQKQRMSKSLGTGVDPTAVIETMGADALRYTLLSQAGMNQEIIYSEKRLDDSRNFCNKIWNAARFVLMNLSGNASLEFSSLEPEDAWILSRLAAAEEAARIGYEGYDLMTAAAALESFFWYELCDWYIEISKHRLTGTDSESKQNCQAVLLRCFDAFLKMLHPLMPFITEEVYSYLPIQNKSRFVMEADWPAEVQQLRNLEQEERVARWLRITRNLRALRADLEIDPRKTIAVAYFEGDLQGGEEVVRTQAWIENLTQGKPAEDHLTSTGDGIDLHLTFEGINREKLLEKAKRDEVKFADEQRKTMERLQDPQFVERAKPEVVEKMQSTAEELTEKLAKVKQRISLLS